MYESDDSDFISCGLMILLAIAVTALVIVPRYLNSQHYDVTIAVVSTTWERVSPIERYSIVHMDTAVSQVPEDAFNIEEYTRRHYNLLSEKWEKVKMAKYDVKRWVVDHELKTSGGKKDERVWPTFKPDADLFVGALREGTRRESFLVSFVRKDNNQPLEYFAPDYQTWIKYSVEQYYTIQFTRLELPLWNTLKLK